MDYLTRKLFFGAFTVFVVITLTFITMHLVPGDPISEERAMSPEIRANLEEKYGLNKPVIEQYWVFLKNLSRGDLGISFVQRNRPVNDIIASHFPVSALLGILALLIALVGGVTAGVIAACFRNKAPDTIVMLMASVGFSVPSFVLAGLAQLAIVAINRRFNAHILPSGGFETLTHLIVPAFILGLATMGSIASLMRSSLLEVMHHEYIRTAKAKGLSSTRIFFSHKLRNAFLPLLTFLGPAIAYITTGGFAIESVFAIPGLGRYFVQAVQQLDYTVIMGITVFYGSYLVLIVTLMDVLYGILDPRIRVGKASA